MKAQGGQLLLLQPVQFIIPSFSFRPNFIQLPATAHLNCKENPIYAFLFWKLRGRSPNFNIHGCSTTGKPTRSFATERVSLDSV